MDHVEVSVDLVERAEVVSEVTSVTKNAVLFFVEHPAVLRLVFLILGGFGKTKAHQVELFSMRVFAACSKMAESINRVVVAHLKRFLVCLSGCHEGVGLLKDKW